MQSLASNGRSLSSTTSHDGLGPHPLASPPWHTCSLMIEAGGVALAAVAFLACAAPVRSQAQVLDVTASGEAVTGVPGGETMWFVSRHEYAEQYGLGCDETVQELLQAPGAKLNAPDVLAIPDTHGPAARIQLSPLEGIGVFTSRPVAAGEDILVADPALLLLDYPDDGSYPFETQCCGNGTISKLHHMDSILTDHGELSIGSQGVDAFINHSPDPNARIEVRYLVRGVPGKGRPALVSMHSTLVALRDLDEDVEATYDYGTFNDARLPHHLGGQDWAESNASLDTMGCGSRIAARQDA